MDEGFHVIKTMMREFKITDLGPIKNSRSVSHKEKFLGAHHREAKTMSHHLSAEAECAARTCA